MNVEFKTSQASGRMAVLIDGKIAFETYNLSRNEWGKFKDFVSRLHDESYEEGRCRQLADASIASSGG